MFSIGLVVYGLVAPVAGGLIDRFGPRLVLPVGACIMGGGLALCSLATAQWQFYLLFGVVVAIGLSLAGWTPFIVIVSNWFTEQRGLAFGIMATAFGFSLLMAPVAQLLISTFSWQAAYVIIGLFAVVVIVPLCTLFVRVSPLGKEVIHSMPRIEPEQTLDEPQKSISSEIAWADATWTLSRAVRTYQFWLLVLIGFCAVGIAEQIAIAHQVYFYRDLGYEPMVAATIYSTFGVAFVVGTLCGHTSDRFGREKVFLPSCLLSIVAVFLLLLIKDNSQPWILFLSSICFGLGLGTMTPVFYATVADLFQGKYLGAIQGVITLGFALGGAVSPWLAGFLYDRTASYFLAFLVSLGCLVASAVFMWLIAPRKLRPVPGQIRR